MDLKISKEGLQNYLAIRDPSRPDKNLLWTTDYRV